MNDIKFDIYTFQLSPTSSENLQLDLFGSNYTKEQLIDLKNKFFYDVLIGEIKFVHRQKNLNFKIIYQTPEFILLRLANKKNVSIEKQFHKASFESEPSCLIAINNDSEQQLIAVESDKTSFGNSLTAVKVFKKSVSSTLNKLNLKITINARYEESEFWDLINKYNGEIEKIQFEFTYPNLPRVNKFLTDELKETSKILNSNSTKIEFDAPKDKFLENLSEDNPKLVNFVKASAAGAGPVKVKIKDLRAWEKTGNSIRSIQIGEIEIDATQDSVEKYVKTLKDLLNNDDGNL